MNKVEVEMLFAAKMATVRRVARRALHHFLAFALAISTLSTISVVTATSTNAAISDSNCTPIVSGLTATGTADGNDCIIRITAGTGGTGTWTTPTGITTANVLLVGGGGAGGTAFNGAGGGGGGGQVTVQSNLAISGTITIQIGAGGAPNATIGNSTAGADGGLTFFDRPLPAARILALGGSGGASVTTLSVGSPRSTGFNGGGGSTWAGTRTTGSAGAVGGFAGGNARLDGGDANFQAGGGGGGANQNGFSAGLGNPAVGGNGGAGVSNSFGPTTQTYGGGGGGGKRTTTGSPGSGGAGGGGDGGKPISGQSSRTGDGANGTNNTGGGGGGAGGEAVGGSGGHGVVIIRYTAEVVPNISYSPTTISGVIGSSISAVTPTNSGSAATYTVSPALPAALSINSSTGVISGTPTGASAAATYTVTATNSAGSDTFDVTISVVSPITVPNIAYSQSTLAVSVGASISALTPTNSGSGATYTVSPALPAGLSINSSTGVISGTPTGASAAATYTVTATNSAGSDTFVFTISTIAAPGVSYSPTIIVGSVNSPITAVTPTNSGSAATWSVSPSLPVGLSINSSTGVISGTPTAASAILRYVVTASNLTGSSTFELIISVIAAPVLNYPSTSIPAVATVPINPLSPTNTGGSVAYFVTPALPAGLTLNPTTGVISGTPTGASAAGIYKITVTNSAGSSSFNLTINVATPTPTPTPAPTPAPTPTPTGVSIANITFGSGTAALNTSTRKALDLAAKRIVDGGFRTVNLAGYTDNRGSAAVNLRLSRDRALAVQRYLESKLGSFKVVFNLRYFGMANQISTGDTAQAQAANRRVEVAAR